MQLVEEAAGVFIYNFYFWKKNKTRPNNNSFQHCSSHSRSIASTYSSVHLRCTTGMNSGYPRKTGSFQRRWTETNFHHFKRSWATININLLHLLPYPCPTCKIMAEQNIKLHKWANIYCQALQQKVFWGCKHYLIFDNFSLSPYLSSPFFIGSTDVPVFKL